MMQVPMNVRPPIWTWSGTRCSRDAASSFACYLVAAESLGNWLAALGACPATCMRNRKLHMSRTTCCYHCRNSAIANAERKVIVRLEAVRLNGISHPKLVNIAPPDDAFLKSSATTASRIDDFRLEADKLFKESRPWPSAGHLLPM